MANDFAATATVKSYEATSMTSQAADSTFSLVVNAFTSLEKSSTSKAVITRPVSGMVYPRSVGSV